MLPGPEQVGNGLGIGSNEGAFPHLDAYISMAIRDRFLIDTRKFAAVELRARDPTSLLGARLESRIGGALFKRLTAYAFRRDMTLPFEMPPAKIPITIREAVDADADILFADDMGLDQTERMELAWRRAHFAKRLPTCFVAIDERNGKPCYAQWLMTSAINAEIQKLGPFPWLADDEALLENAYTPPAYRALGIMTSAGMQVAHRTLGLGARYAVTIVGEDNTASLKVCKRAGSKPYLRRTTTLWLYGLIRQVRFETLPDNFVLPERR